MYKEIYKILLVDDEKDILEFLSYNLKKEGFNVFTANNGKKAIEVAKEVKPHLILLDVMMPEMDGMETCEIIRKDDELKHIIVAFLTARGEDYSQIAGFDAGADDYIKKPVKPKVLISRIKALLKRVSQNAEQNDSEKIIKTGDLLIDLNKHKVLKNGVEIKLPRKEFNLLVLLAGKADYVFTRDDIFSMVWGDDIIVGDRTIDVHIRKLREKLGNQYIETIKGVGYKFVE
ncbi:MAG: response regulator transcription factor [Chlorobi bacterium]|nr:response regulator transcription factor [Chlorobiota bacterium]